MLDIAREALERHGYRVLTACDSSQALEVLEREGQRIDVIISDVVLPGMSGPELIRKIAPRYPWIRVLFASGYVGDEPAEFGLLDRGAHFIQKPYTPMELAARVRQLLLPPDGGPREPRS